MVCISTAPQRSRKCIQDKVRLQPSWIYCSCRPWSHLCCCSPAGVWGTYTCDIWRWPPAWLWSAADSAPLRLCRGRTATPRLTSSFCGPSSRGARRTWRSCPGYGCWAAAWSWPSCPGRSRSSRGCRRCGGRWGGAWGAESPRMLSSVRCAGGAVWWAEWGQRTLRPPPWRCRSAAGPGSLTWWTGRTCCLSGPKDGDVSYYFSQ